jgi:hypothetical protein
MSIERRLWAYFYPVHERQVLADSVEKLDFARATFFQNASMIASQV